MDKTKPIKDKAWIIIKQTEKTIHNRQIKYGNKYQHKTNELYLSVSSIRSNPSTIYIRPINYVYIRPINYVYIRPINYVYIRPINYI
jgi:hypothetical protein